MGGLDLGKEEEESVGEEWENYSQGVIYEKIKNSFYLKKLAKSTRKLEQLKYAKC